MRLHKRILSLLLSAALLLPALPPARAAERETGSVSATLRVDYPQSLEALRNRSVQAELFQGSRSLGTLDLTRQDESDLDGFPAAVTLTPTLRRDRPISLWHVLPASTSGTSDGPMGTMLCPSLSHSLYPDPSDPVAG